MTRSLRSTRLILTAVTLAVIAAGCGDARTSTVGPVSVDVPGGWDSVGPDVPADDLVAEERWRQPGTEPATLQVLVGCGDGDADQLRQAMGEAYQLDREPEATAVDVVGLRSAQRIEWELRADPGGEAGSFRMTGLYGAGSGGLVVVELGAPAASFEPELAAQVLDSVEVDADDLASRCTDQG